MLNKAMLAVLVCVGALSAGCNTVSGAGQDVSAAGKAVTGAAERAK
jgi:entericidin B